MQAKSFTMHISLDSPTVTPLLKHTHAEIASLLGHNKDAAFLKHSVNLKTDFRKH